MDKRNKDALMGRRKKVNGINDRRSSWIKDGGGKN
jgi:hypothetical protein